jgi:hypothetical protein
VFSEHSSRGKREAKEKLPYIFVFLTGPDPGSKTGAHRFREVEAAAAIKLKVCEEINRSK